LLIDLNDDDAVRRPFGVQITGEEIERPVLVGGKDIKEKKRERDNEGH
jgi:hypothetical protein